MPSVVNIDAEMRNIPDDKARLWGFNRTWSGPHTSRSMRLDDLSLLLEATAPDAAPEACARAVKEDNVLMKATMAGRSRGWAHLRALYALDPQCGLFATFRMLWEADPPGRPLLALALALARDPILRATAEHIVPLADGQAPSKAVLEESIDQASRGGLGSSTLRLAVGNALATWTQSGHLSQGPPKVRKAVSATPGATAYALLLGSLCGRSGESLVAHSPWVLALDAGVLGVMALAERARDRGLLEVRAGGGILEYAFPALMQAVRPPAAPAKRSARGGFPRRRAPRP